jgi:large subunit ribosomal protein L13
MKKGKSPQKRKYYLLDCGDYVLGRLAAKAAFILQGKNDPDYFPNKETPNWVVAINSAKIQITGNKKKQKAYHHFSGYPGGISSRSLEELMKIDPDRVIKEAVYGMLPKNKLRDRMMKRLVVKEADDHGLKVEFEK